MRCDGVSARSCPCHLLLRFAFLLCHSVALSFVPERSGLEQVILCTEKRGSAVPPGLGQGRRAE